MARCHFYGRAGFWLRVKIKNKYYYLEAFNNFDAFGTPYAYLEGTEGYSIGYDEVDRYFRTTVPASKHADNIDKQDYAIRFNAAMDIVEVDRTSSYLGNDKTSKIGPANLDRSYLAYDFAKYFAEPKGKEER